MTISDAQFAAWVATDARKVVLCEMEFAYQSAGNVAEGTLYLANAIYSSGAADSPASQPYAAVIRKLPTISRSVPVRGQRSEISLGNMEILNLDRGYDWLLKKVVDGWEARFYLGAPEGTPGWTRNDFRLVCVAVVERVRSNERVLTVHLRDKRLLLNQEIQGEQVGGSGPEATKYLPLLWGSHFNVEALIYDAATNTYSFVSNSPTTAAIQDVRDAGLSLTDPPVSIGNVFFPLITANAATETLTLTAHGLAVNDVVWFQKGAGGPLVNFAPFPGFTSGQRYWVIASGLTADNFKVSATRGGSAIDITGTTYAGGDGDFMNVQRWFHDPSTGRLQLSADPAGRVTLDVLGVTTYTTAPFAFAKHLIETYGNVVGADIESAAFTAADTALDAKISLPYLNYSVMPRENLLDVLDKLMEAVFGWYGVDEVGLITCGVMDVSGIASATATRTLSASEVIEPGISVENLPPGYEVVNIEMNTNHTVQGDGLLAGVDPQDLRDYASPYREIWRSAAPSGTAYATNKRLYHKTMAEKGPTRRMELSTNLYGSDVVIVPSGAFDYPAEVVADQLPTLQAILAPRDFGAYGWGLGEIVEVTYERFDLDDGENAMLVGIETDLDQLQISHTMLRQFTPDLTSATS